MFRPCDKNISTQIYETNIDNLLFFISSVRLLLVVFFISLQVVVNDIFVVLLTRLHHLQDSYKAPVQSKEVCLSEEGGHACQRILGQRLPHDITQTEAREGQETQAEQGGATDSS